MSYTNIEKQAIIKVLSDMMMADGFGDHQEVLYLDHVKEMLGLPSLIIDSSMNREKACDIISKMNEDQKFEIAGMLYQMIMADGIQDKNETYLYGEIITKTGILEAMERKTAGQNIQYDDAQIYLNASKISLSNRSDEYLHVIDDQAKMFKNIFSNYFLTSDDKCDLILDYTRQSVKSSGWDANDVDGVTWFIGNFTDAMVKSGAIDNYDTMFVKCFKKYFNIN